MANSNPTRQAGGTDVDRDASRKPNRQAGGTDVDRDASRKPNRQAGATDVGREVSRKPNWQAGATDVDREDHARRADLEREAVRGRVRQLLLAELASHFEYPWIARRRGWQGMVRLSVTVRADGALERIHVTRSSGYEVLDRSAVETMQRVGQLAHAGHWLDGRALELPLAIVYRLTD